MILSQCSTVVSCMYIAPLVLLLIPNGSSTGPFNPGHNCRATYFSSLTASRKTRGQSAMFNGLACAHQDTYSFSGQLSPLTRYTGGASLRPWHGNSMPYPAVSIRRLSSSSAAFRLPLELQRTRPSVPIRPSVHHRTHKIRDHDLLACVLRAPNSEG